MSQFGTTADGRDVEKVTLTNGDLTVSVLTWGAVLQDVRLRGIDRSLTLGSNRLSDYEGDMRYHGSLIGPIVNRISTSRVLIDGMMYELERNQDGRIHLHSGAQSTLFQVWEIVAQSETSVTLRYDLMDGQCGLPGNRQVNATYSLTDDAQLSLRIDATTDAKTLMNFANHSYWNFDGSECWDGHELQIFADQVLPTTIDNYPTGDVQDVSGTDLDFRIAKVVSPKDPALDHNFCLSETQGSVSDVLVLRGTSGVGVRIASDQKGIQIYDGRDALRPGKQKYEGLAIEAQGWPDAPNNPGFPSIEVTPENPYVQNTRWTFFKP